MATSIFALSVAAWLSILWLANVARGHNPYAVEVQGSGTDYYTELKSSPSATTNNTFFCETPECSKPGCTCTPSTNGGFCRCTECQECRKECECLLTRTSTTCKCPPSTVPATDTASQPMKVPRPFPRQQQQTPPEETSPPQPSITGRPFSSSATSPSGPTGASQPHDGIKSHTAKEELKDILHEECANVAAAELCEDRVIAELLQTHILNNDVEGIADLLTKATRVAGIAGGLRIPRGYDFTANENIRNVDPDVAAVKGLALAIIDGTDADTPEGTADSASHGLGLVNKLVDAIVISSQPPRDAIFLCDVDLRPVYSLETGVTISKSLNCSMNVTGGLVDAAQLRASLLDMSLMAEIIEADADVEDRRRHLMGAAGRRSLECKSCDNAEGFICSNCWKASFCSQFDWCP